MRVLKLFAIVAVAFFVTGAGRDYAFRAPTVSYSGVATGFFDGVQVLRVKTFYGVTRVRLESSQDGRDVVVIFDRGAKVQYVLLPAQKVYTRGPIKGNPSYSSEVVQKGADIRAVGEERISGLLATKFKVRSRLPDGGQFDGFVWQSKKNILVKVDGNMIRGGRTRKFLMTMTDLRVGSLDPKLFQVPAGFKMVKP